MSLSSGSSSLSSGHSSHQTSRFRQLTIGAIGVVYGDIGTSPIYAFREAIHQAAENGGTLAPADILGILSLIIWSLIIIVTVKYVGILLKVDNHGEGGMLALMALARSVAYRNTTAFLFVGMAGAALFYGDAIITPAISVLSAVEGLELVTPSFHPFIVPIAIGIILALFIFQFKGTAKVSTLFGPITLIWFITIAVMGINPIMQNPQVLASFSPHHGALFLIRHSGVGLVTLGAVFLAVTGAEALYADLGHFGRKPILTAWVWVVFPALLINYLGQGALLIAKPDIIDNPFFKMVSPSMLIPLVILATLATIIASQAVITGAYSLTAQAVNLGLLPRMDIKHTSAEQQGQIYLPHVNYILLIGVLVLTLLFQSSSNLAIAYGISVTGTMILTATMIFFVVWQLWEWPLVGAIALVAPFFLIDGVFLAANMLKVTSGGWMPLTLAVIMIVIMMTWIQGTFIISSRARKREALLEKFIAQLPYQHPEVTRVSGTAVFLVSDATRTPPALLQNIRHNKVLHTRNIILSVKIESLPVVPEDQRFFVHHLDQSFSVVMLRFGFKEHPDVQAALIRMSRDAGTGLNMDWVDTSIFISRRSVKSHPKYGLPLWQDFLYIWLSKCASDPVDYYKLPRSRVVEIGRQVVV